MAFALEAEQHVVHACEQGNVALVLAVLRPIGLRQQGVAVGGHVGRGQLQRLLQIQTDNVARRFVARGRAAQFGHGGLQAAHDIACGIEQGAVPVKNNQGVALQHGSSNRTKKW